MVSVDVNNIELNWTTRRSSSGAAWKSRWPSWAYSLYGLCGRKQHRTELNNLTFKLRSCVKVKVSFLDPISVNCLCGHSTCLWRGTGAHWDLKRQGEIRSSPKAHDWMFLTTTTTKAWPTYVVHSGPVNGGVFVSKCVTWQLAEGCLSVSWWREVVQSPSWLCMGVKIALRSSSYGTATDSSAFVSHD